MGEKRHRHGSEQRLVSHPPVGVGTGTPRMSPGVHRRPESLESTVLESCVLDFPGFSFRQGTKNNLSTTSFAIPVVTLGPEDGDCRHSRPSSQFDGVSDRQCSRGWFPGSSGGPLRTPSTQELLPSELRVIRTKTDQRFRLPKGTGSVFVLCPLWVPTNNDRTNWCDTLRAY